MSNYIEFKEKIAFHPGYYIEEIVEESGLTQADFAKRLDTTPKNLSLLIRGEQSLSIDIAMKLSRMLGTSVDYWLNLQKGYDVMIAEMNSEQELEREKRIFAYLDYKFFVENYGLSKEKSKTTERIETLREFLHVSSLTVLAKPDLAVSFRSAKGDLTEVDTVKANAMVQIAVNKAMTVEAPKYNKREFEKAVEYALTLTRDHANFYNLIYQRFLEAGVILEILPNIEGSSTNGATKKIGNNVMLMVNDRRLHADSFWFTLFHEIGHIINGDFGISLDQDKGELEEKADKYAEDSLIPHDQYIEFLNDKKYDLDAIMNFAKKIGRDPGIVLGRLQNDGYADSSNQALAKLRHKYRVKTALA